MTKSADEAYAELKKTFTPDKIRPAVVLNLDDPEDLRLVNGSLKWAPGLVPGEPNEGLVAGKFIEAPPRLADFDDSSWETPANIRDVVGTASPSPGTASPSRCRNRSRAWTWPTPRYGSRPAPTTTAKSG